MTVAAKDRQPPAIGAGGGADGGRRQLQASSGPPVTNTRAVRKIDDDVLNATVDRAIVAVSEQCDVGLLSALGDGSVAVTQPKRREALQRALSEITILVAPIVLHRSSEYSAEAQRAEAIANSNCSTTKEAQALLDLALARVEVLATKPRFWQIHAALRNQIERSGGSLDLKWTGPRDQSPLIEIAPPAITISMAPAAPPIVNVEPTPITVENNVELTQPDKVVSFSRNYEGEIIEATTSSVGAA